MKCDRARQSLYDTPGVVARGLLGLHLLRCSACRAEARQVRALDAALTALARFHPSPDLLPRVLARAQRYKVSAEPRKETRPMKRLAFVAAFLIVIGLVVGGVLIKPDRPDGRSLLISAAQAMEEAKTIYVRGRANVGGGDEAPWGRIDDGYYEAWYSPAGRRHDSYDADGILTRSSVNSVESGIAYIVCGPNPWFPNGVVTAYPIGTEHLARTAENARKSYLQAELRFAHLSEEYPVLSTRTALWKGRHVTVVEQDIGTDATGPKGTWEWYLDPSTGRLLGMNRYGPESHGKPLIGTIEIVEYGIEIPAGIFEFDPPPGVAVLEDDFEIQGEGLCLHGPASFFSPWQLTPTDAWHASASTSASPTKPESAIDRNPETRWTARGRHHLQEPGMWFQLDFDTPVRVSKLIVQHAPFDSSGQGWPRGIQISATSDGVTWEDVYTGPASADAPAYGHLGASPQILGLRFELTEYSDEEPWTISDIELYGRPER